MKKFKKLIPALCMLLISAVLMGTSTYAWFSMNTTVTANGMEVKAKSDSKFLQIVAGNSADAFKNDQAQISATATNASGTLKPIAVAKAVTNDSITPLDKDTSVDNIKWAEAFSNNPASSTKVTKYNEITTLDNYVLLNSFMVRMNPTTGASKSTTPLTITGLTITSTNETANDIMKSAVSVLFVCGDNFVLYQGGNYTTSLQITGSTNPLMPEVTETATEIKVYVFFNGEDAATTTNNATTLDPDGYKVEFSLSI